MNLLSLNSETLRILTNFLIKNLQNISVWWKSAMN